MEHKATVPEISAMRLYSMAAKDGKTICMPWKQREDKPASSMVGQISFLGMARGFSRLQDNSQS